jgi:hypothetical protein
MTIDINEDRRLRDIWRKYKNRLASFPSRGLIEHEMRVNQLSLWDANEILKQEIRKIEYQRREELTKTRILVRAEKKIQEEQEKKENEEKRVQAAEKKLMTRELRKVQLVESPPPLRRSARIHSKTSNDPLTSYKRGSMYTKTA